MKHSNSLNPLADPDIGQGGHINLDIGLGGHINPDIRLGATSIQTFG